MLIVIVVWNECNQSTCPQWFEPALRSHSGHGTIWVFLHKFYLPCEDIGKSLVQSPGWPFNRGASYNVTWWNVWQISVPKIEFSSDRGRYKTQRPLCTTVTPSLKQVIVHFIQLDCSVQNPPLIQFSLLKQQMMAPFQPTAQDSIL